jgi:hypothetical protein
LLHIQAETGSEAYLTLLEALVNAPVVSPRGLSTRELRNVSIEVTNPFQAHVLNTARKPNLKIAAVEGYQLVAGVSSLWQLDEVSGGRFSRYADNGRLRGAYGPKTHGQLIDAYVHLKNDPDTRQAYVTVWDGSEFDDESHDVPCTTSLQFFIRDSLLELRVSMRSNDAWLGFPIDVMQFSLLHRTMAASLATLPGSYVHTVGSMHLYETNLADANTVIDAGEVKPWGADEVQGGLPVLPKLPYSKGGFASRSRFVEDFIGRPDNAAIQDYGPLVAWAADRVPVLPKGSGTCLNCRYVVQHACDTCDKEIE